jgi:hypothetical protein
METVDLKALVAFGKVGMDMMASRILSLCALVGTVALSAYVAYSPSWQGAACVAIVACATFIPAIHAESKARQAPGE